MPVEVIQKDRPRTGLADSQDQHFPFGGANRELHLSSAEDAREPLLLDEENCSARESGRRRDQIKIESEVRGNSPTSRGMKQKGG
jgi:hypothetical protein